jgi:spore cortex biosynthesis protein YabQ
MISISGQAATFLLFVAMGFALGIFYDIFRILRKIVRHNAVFISIEDLIFWTVSAGLLFILLLRVNFGELRFFVLLAAGLGLALYFGTLSHFFLKLGDLAKKGLRNGTRYVKIRFTKIKKGVALHAKKFSKVRKLRKAGGKNRG